MSHFGKNEIYALLGSNNIPFEKLEHPAVYTMEEMDAAGISRKGNICKNLFLRDAKGKNHFLVTAPEHKKTDLRTLAEKIESTKLSFASAERLDKYLGVAHGSVSPLCVLNDGDSEVTVVFDADLRTEHQIGVHPCDNTATIWLDFADLYKIVKDHGNRVVFVNFELQEE